MSITTTAIILVNYCQDHNYVIVFNRLYDVGKRILKMLTYVPKIKPTIPNIIINIFLKNIQWYLPMFGQNVNNSIKGGNINASPELLNAPTKDIIFPKFGTAIARQNVKNTNAVRTTYSPIKRCSSVDKYCFTTGQIILNGT